MFHSTMIIPASSYSQQQQQQYSSIILHHHYHHHHLWHHAYQQQHLSSSNAVMMLLQPPTSNVSNVQLTYPANSTHFATIATSSNPKSKYQNSTATNSPPTRIPPPESSCSSSSCNSSLSGKSTPYYGGYGSQPSSPSSSLSTFDDSAMMIHPAPCLIPSFTTTLMDSHSSLIAPQFSFASNQPLTTTVSSTSINPSPPPLLPPTIYHPTAIPSLKTSLKELYADLGVYYNPVPWNQSLYVVIVAVEFALKNFPFQKYIAVWNEYGCRNFDEYFPNFQPNYGLYNRWIRNQQPILIFVCTCLSIRLKFVSVVR